jgi:predicted ATPase
LQQASLLVIGAYRDGEVDRDHPLLKTVVELSRLRRSRLITLAGLDPADVAHFMQAFIGRTPVTTLLTTIMNETGGNPFFMTEVARQLLREDPQATGDVRTALLPTLRGAIRQRLSRLSRHCNQMLNQAAVIGREFSLMRLVRLGSLTQEFLLAGLDEAIQAQLIQPISSIAGVAGRYRFVHDLVRETLYAELSTAERLRWHQRVGEMLEQVHAADPDVHLAELSYHFCHAAPLGAMDKAIDYTVRAAERSLQALAYEEASRYYTQALELLAAQEKAETAQRTDLLLALGKAQMHSGESATARATFERAATIARQTHDYAAMAHAALGMAGGVVQPGIADDRIIALLTEAFTALGKPENTMGTRLLARLAMEYRYSTARAQGEELSRSAVAMARQFNTHGANRDEERAALVLALNARHFAILAPDTLEERMAISLELAQLAQARGDRELMLQSLPWRVADMLALGHIQAADEAIDQAGQMASTLRQPLYLWYVSVFRSLRAHMQGRLAEGESLAETAYTLGRRV